MARWEIEKVASAHLLEALKVSLDHLRDFTMTGQPADFASTRGGAATYAQLRRMRTYVQRCVSAYSDRVELDLNEDDQNLLAACAVFEVANLDRRLGGPTRAAGDDVEWLEGRRRTLAHWAVAFATRKVEHIPVSDESVFLTNTVQNVLREIQRRLVAVGQVSGIHRVTRETAGLITVPPHAAASSSHAHPAQADPHPAWPSPGQVAPQPAYGDPSWVGVPPGQTAYYAPYPQDPRGQPPPARPPSQSPPPSRTFGIPAPLDGPPGAAAQGAPAPGYAPAHAPQPPAAIAAPIEDGGHDAAVGCGMDLDPRKLNDPRLRSILMLDLRALDRALRANDHRMCIVHLGSVLEAACIDYALAHRRELALSGAPETWNLEVVVNSVVGEISSMDRALLFHLSAARNLLRPAIQLTNPMVVTAAVHASLVQFVRRVLALMGYVSTGEPQPAPASQPHLAAAHPRAGSGAPPSWVRGT